VKRLGVAGFGWLTFAAAANAQFKSRPFAVAGGEGGGGGEGIVGWLMAEQSQLTHLMATKVHALHESPSAVWGLVALGLVYGVLHAAGAGHGKAVIASYMLANERSLIWGAALALLAALLQAAIAVSLVGAAAFMFNATASGMNQAADAIVLTSYGGVVAIGLWLSWRKGRALIVATRRYHERRSAVADAPDYEGVAWSLIDSCSIFSGRLSLVDFMLVPPGINFADTTVAQLPLRQSWHDCTGR
jgi:hypothetical protein